MNENDQYLYLQPYRDLLSTPPDMSSILKPIDIYSIKGTGKPINVQTPKVGRAGITNQILGKALNAAGGAMDLVQTGMGMMSQVQDINQLMNVGGTGNVMGVNYNTYNVDGNAAMDQINQTATSGILSSVGKGAAAGSAFGPIGTSVGAAVGGVFGGILGNHAEKKQQKKVNDAIALANRTNAFNKAGAMTTGLNNNYYSQYGNNSDGILNANHGKDNQRADMKNSYRMMNGKVWSPVGYTHGQTNSLVGLGEVIGDNNPEDPKWSVVSKGKGVGVDDQPSSVSSDDNNVILGNDIDPTNGLSYAEQGRPYAAKIQANNERRAQLDKIKSTYDKDYSKKSSLAKQTAKFGTQMADIASEQLRAENQQLNAQMEPIKRRQEFHHAIQNIEEMRRNKTLPGYDYGKVPAWMTAAGRLAPMATDLALLSSWANDRPKGANIYRANPYSGIALNGLNGLRYNLYNQRQAQSEAEGRAAYNLSQAGGLTGGQRYLGRTALALDNMRNAGNSYFAEQQANIPLRSQYYNALNQAGEAERAAASQAAQYNYDTYAKAHGARRKGIETHSASFAQQLQKWMADLIYNKQYSDTLGLYAASLSDAQRKWLSGRS